MNHSARCQRALTLILSENERDILLLKSDLLKREVSNPRALVEFRLTAASFAHREVESHDTIKA